MSTNDEERASAGVPVGDDERQSAVDALCEAFADDRIRVEEFEKRVEVAHRAETIEELKALLSDLPAPKPPAVREEKPKPERSSDSLSTSVRRSKHPLLPPEAVRENSLIAGVMGGGKRRGAWRPARVNYAVGVLGGFELDFRDAPLPPGVTEVRVLCLLGGGEIIVPPQVAVEVSAVGLMGGFEEQHDLASTRDPDAPVIRVTGLAVCGGGSITVRHPGESRQEARRRRREERRSRRKKRMQGE